jgi:hypothetical protein
LKALWDTDSTDEMDFLSVFYGLDFRKFRVIRVLKFQRQIIRFRGKQVQSLYPYSAGCFVKMTVILTYNCLMPGLTLQDFVSRWKRIPIFNWLSDLSDAKILERLLSLNLEMGK